MATLTWRAADQTCSLVKLIRSPKGQRPFQTVVDEMFEQVLNPYNKMLDDIQQNLLNNFGIGNLAQLQP